MSDEIRQFIAENREIATVQAQRWQGVDPSRLLQALDYLEGLLDKGGRALPVRAIELSVVQMAVHRDITMPGAHVSVEASGYLESWQIDRLVADVRENITKARLSL